MCIPHTSLRQKIRSVITGTMNRTATNRSFVASRSGGVSGEYPLPDDALQRRRHRVRHFTDSGGGELVPLVLLRKEYLSEVFGSDLGSVPSLTSSGIRVETNLRTKFVLAFCAVVIMVLAAACGDGPDVGSVSPEIVPGSISTPNPQPPAGLQEIDSDPNAPFRFFVDSRGGQTISCRNANEFVMDMRTSLVPVKIRDQFTRDTVLVTGFFFGTCADPINQQKVRDFQMAVVASIPEIVASRSWGSLEELKVFIQGEIDRQAAKLPQALRDAYDAVVKGEYFLLDFTPVFDVS